MLSNFNAAEEAERIISWLREVNYTVLKRDGGVVGVSGGIDSATVLHLMVQAFGPKQVVALVLPDRDSSPSSAPLALEMASPKPMLTLIFTSLGAAMTFLYPNCFVRAGTASVLYNSRSLLMI